MKRDNWVKRSIFSQMKQKIIFLVLAAIMFPTLIFRYLSQTSEVTQGIPKVITTNESSKVYYACAKESTFIPEKYYDHWELD